MIKKQITINKDIKFSDITANSEVVNAEQEQENTYPSIIKQNYGWISLGGAFVILSIVLIVLLIKSKESIGLMVTFIVICFLFGATLLILPFLLNKYRLCSIQLIEASGKEVFDEFNFLTTDNTLDKAIQLSFTTDVYSKLTNKKELEVLEGEYKGLNFTTYDFKATNETVSSILTQLEGTLIKIKVNINIKNPTYVASNSYADFFSSLEKLPIGDDNLIYFGNSKEEINTCIDLKKLASLNLPFIASINSNTISILLFGKTVDIRKIKRGPLSQAKYELLADNFNPLLYILDSIQY